MSSYPTKVLSMASSMISGMIELITTGLSLDLREIRIETFLFGWYGRDNRVPRVSKSVHSGLRVEILGRGLRRRVDVPAIAPLFVAVVRRQAGTSDRCRRDSSGSLPSAGTFHTSVTHRRGAIQRLYSHEFAWPYRGKSPTMDSTQPCPDNGTSYISVLIAIGREISASIILFVRANMIVWVLVIIVASREQIKITLILILTIYMIWIYSIWNIVISLIFGALVYNWLLYD